MRRSFRELFMIVLVFLTLSGLMLQLYLTSYTTLVNSGEGVIAVLTEFFGYFTVFANWAIVVDLLILLTKPRSRLRFYVNRRPAIWAFGLFILSLILLLVLVMHNSSELRVVVQRTVAVLLHAVTPLMFIFCWMFLVPREELHGRRVGFWMLFTTINVSLILYRGEILEDYALLLVEGTTLSVGGLFMQMNAFMFLLANFFILWMGIEWAFHRLPFLYKKMSN